MCVDFDTRQRNVNVSRLFVSAVKITCWLISYLYTKFFLTTHFTFEVSFQACRKQIFTDSTWPAVTFYNINKMNPTPQQLRDYIDDIDAVLRAAIVAGTLKTVHEKEKGRIVSFSKIKFNF